MQKVNKYYKRSPIIWSRIDLKNFTSAIIRAQQIAEVKSNQATNQHANRFCAHFPLFLFAPADWLAIKYYTMIAQPLELKPT